MRTEIDTGETTTMRRIALTATLLAGISGCGGEPRFDASSPEAAKASVNRMTAGMDEPQKKKFLAAYMKLAMRGAFGKGAKKAADDPLKEFDGMTASEIIRKSESAPKP